jgi:predicted dehydrogenase
MLRVGIAGFGKMGQIRAAAIEQSGAARVALVYTPEPIPDCPYPLAGSIEAVVTSPELDAIFVCLPNYLNAPTTIAALGRGKHVFCEKPPALDAAELKGVIAAERAADRILMYGFNHRHHAGVVTMKEIIDGARFGRILWMRGRYGKRVDGDYLSTWRARKELAGGGILLDQGIHMLDLFLYMAGEPFDEVKAMISNLYWKTPDIEDNVFAMLRNKKSGLCASLHSTMTQWRHLFSLEVFLERGYLVLNGLKTSSETYGEEILTIAKNRTTAPAATWEDEDKLHFADDTSWRSEIDDFLRAVEGGGPVAKGSSAQALTVMELVDAIYRNERHEAASLRSDLAAFES